MNTGRTIFSQLMDFLPIHEFRQCVQRYPRQLQDPELFLLGPVSLLGLCPTHLSRKALRDIQVCSRAARREATETNSEWRIPHALVCGTSAYALPPPCNLSLNCLETMCSGSLGTEAQSSNY